MAQFVNGWPTLIAAVAGTIVVMLLNLFLIVQTLGVRLPGFGS